ncbi:hypothetical protein ACFWIG_03595 [Corynebacterium bovis]|uniref:hypothetical protein n=1 Tax=Corynebacterium bovis TaxID=36808 RepID=UPI0036C4EA59
MGRHSLTRTTRRRPAHRAHRPVLLTAPVVAAVGVLVVPGTALAAPQPALDPSGTGRGGVPVGPVGAVGVRRAQEERRRVAAVRDEPELLHRAPPGVGYVGDGPPVGSTVSP